MISTLLLTWIVLAVFMSSLWAIHLRLRNAAIVDAGWAAGLPLAAVLYAWRAAAGPRAWLLVALVVAWGGRLAWHLLVARVIGQVEEGRYVELRRGWAPHATAKFFLFFQAQALLDLLLSVAFFVVARDGRPIGAWQVTVATMWALAVAGESVADHQLERFKQNAANKGRVCDTGLWRYSRHPNYFFEWLIWVAYAAYASASPWGWTAWTSPAVMLYFLLRVTGIPATEAQALRSRGDAYRQYQATTSAFVPWPARLGR